jgi:hypothetical protein
MFEAQGAGFGGDLLVDPGQKACEAVSLGVVAEGVLEFPDELCESGPLRQRRPAAAAGAASRTGSGGPGAR